MIFIDSQSTLVLCKNLVYHERSKHVEMKYNFVRGKLAFDKFLLLKIAIDKILQTLELNYLLFKNSTNIYFY